MTDKLQVVTGGGLFIGYRDEYEYLLQIRVADGCENVQLLISISTQAGLDIFEEKTPFEYTFAAKGYYIFFESTPKRTHLVAELFSNEFGDFRKVAGTDGNHGKIIRDPINAIYSSGGF